MAQRPGCLNCITMCTVHRQVVDCGWLANESDSCSTALGAAARMGKGKGGAGEGDLEDSQGFQRHRKKNDE